MLGAPYLGACAGGRVTAPQSLGGGSQTVRRCWAACCAPHHADLQNAQNTGMGCGKMLVSDPEFVEARGLILGERDGFAAVAASFGSQLGFGELAALTGDARGC